MVHERLMNILLPSLVLICLLAALLFVVRLYVAIVSPKVVGQMRKHPVIHIVWGCFAMIGGLFILDGLYPNLWPPRFIERQTQREKVVQRVQAAGGWAALQRDCDALVKEYHDSAFIWHLGNTNELPPAIAALHPREVTFYSPAMVHDSSPDEPQVPVVCIKVFGLHSTGGHSVPYFGLDVVCSTNAGYHPPSAKGGASGNHYDSYRQVTETIFERF